MTDATICKVDGCGKPARHIGLCGPHYKRFNRYGSPTGGGPSHFSNPADALAARTSVNINTGCVEWSGSSDKRGYGQMRIGGKAKKAHRVSYELANGPIPDGLLILHKCDNPRCVNPKHLYAGTYLDNSRDMDDRGRRVNGQPKGEATASAKITEDDVRKIRADKRRQVDIAASFGISQAVVSKIKLMQAWRHVK